MHRKATLLLAAAAMGALPLTATAAVFPETEPNDTKATANAVAGMVAGDSIVGNSIAGFDYFDVTTGPLALGIYRHRLVITSPIAGHSATIRSLSQTASPADTLAGVPWDGILSTVGATEGAAQTSSTATTPARMNQWYGFGRTERFYYRVTGAAATTADYTATMETTAVTPTHVGTYNAGLVTINTFGQGHTTDTDMWVYDSNLDAIPGYGNDDESLLAGTPGAGTSLQSWLPRNYTPGRYYLALSNFALTNNQTSPSDDDFRTGALLDFPNLILNSSTTANLNLAFAISDGVNTNAVANTKVAAYDVNWFVFDVVPEPASMGLCAFALPLLLRRRRV